MRLITLLVLFVLAAVTPSRRASRVLADAGPTLSVPETAAVLGCSADLVRAMHRRGELEQLGIRVLRLGRRIRISTASLRRAVEAEDLMVDTRLTPTGSGTGRQ